MKESVRVWSAEAMKEDHLARLRDAFSREVLFLGFGERAMSPVGRPAPYALNANFASWRVESQIATLSTEKSERTELLAAAAALLGESVEAWQLLDRFGLRLVFTGSKVLVIEPWPIADGTSDAWSLSAPDRHVLAVSNDRRTVIVPVETPISDWF